MKTFLLVGLTAFCTVVTTLTVTATVIAIKIFRHLRKRWS